VGTGLTEIINEFHSQYIPGTAANYAKWEIESESYVEDAYQRANNSKEEHILYEKLLKNWKKNKQSKNWVSFLKLHGSLDCGICSTCKELFAMRLIPFYKAKSIILKHQKYNKAHSTFILCCNNPKLEPLMVPPGWRKDYDNKVLVSIWNEAEERLRHANSIVFLGYSLPNSDEKIRYLFNKTMYNRFGKPWNEIVVVNKDDKVFSKYKHIFKNIRPIKSKVSQYLQQIDQ